MDGDFGRDARRIALLAGGSSAEREVSLASGRQVAIALLKAGYDPVLIDPVEVRLESIDWPTFDACFIALHGGTGEDGRVQAQLGELGVVYTGSGPAASRLAMSKSASKERFARRGVPSLPYVVFPAGEPPKDVAALVDRVGYPVVIKPDGQGSSLGVNVVTRPEQLPRALTEAAQFDSHLVAERLVRGREFTVSLLGRDPLPLIEIRPPGELFTYDGKYSSEATAYCFDTGLAASVEAQIYNAAMAAVEAIGTAGLARVDLMLDEHQSPWVLEVNTVPGLTQRSLAPRAAKAAGMEMSTLVDWMIRDAHLSALANKAVSTIRTPQLAIRALHSALRNPNPALRNRRALAEDAA